VPAPLAIALFVVAAGGFVATLAAAVRAVSRA
jgi:hypothetical protein